MKAESIGQPEVKFEQSCNWLLEPQPSLRLGMQAGLWQTPGSGTKAGKIRRATVSKA